MAAQTLYDEAYADVAAGGTAAVPADSEIVKLAEVKGYFLVLVMIIRLRLLKIRYLIWNIRVMVLPALMMAALMTATNR